MLITGWADGHRNITFRLLAALHDAGTPMQVLAGPWSHASSATSVPGPNVDHVPLMVQWCNGGIAGCASGPLTLGERSLRLRG